MANNLIPSVVGGGADDPKLELDTVGQWLLSLRRDETQLLLHTREFREFIKAARGLESAYRYIQTWHAAENAAQDATRMRRTEEQVPDLLVERGKCSLLQHLVSDEILMRIFNFIECQSLVCVSSTCSRFWDLAHRSARKRTQELVRTRQLSNVMQLLRAQEQMDGLDVNQEVSGTPPHVRVPMLLLWRRVRVTDAGDPEYNGIYYCTGSNGNGFVFTKPRFPLQRADMQRRHHRSRSASIISSSSGSLEETNVENNSIFTRTDEGRLGQPLRCIIAKRFSNETILWYLSKEVIATDEQEDGGTRPGAVIQIFSFWAKLMVIGEASTDICRYPSQTSVLSRNNRNEGWQTLSTTRTIEPPVVELMD